MKLPRHTLPRPWAARLRELITPLALASFLALVVALTGCTSQARAKANAQQAYVAGQQQAAALQREAMEPAVWFKGPVRNPRVPWTEDLTLAQALLVADYTGLSNPFKIDVIRQGKRHSINVGRLLRGTDNPLMEPGDVVEIAR
jgi:hypothetical protein